MVVGNSAGSVTSSPATIAINPAADGSPPAAFWGNTAAIPKATQAMTFSFLNQTNGKYPDSQIFWRVSGHTSAGVQINEVHSIAEQSTYDMPPLTSDTVWANNNIDTSIVPKPTPFLDFANGNITDLSAALNRHVADKPRTFTASGTPVNPGFWSTMPSSTFYQAGPANYYASTGITMASADMRMASPDNVGGNGAFLRYRLYQSDLPGDRDWLVAVAARPAPWPGIIRMPASKPIVISP